MKRGFIILPLVMLTACSSIDTTYYQLPEGQGGRQTTHVNSGTPRHFLWVNTMSVSDYLTGNGLVYQTSDVKYNVAVSNLWASPLDKQLQQRLVTSLGEVMPGWLVSSTPVGDDPDTLTVTVTAFNGRYDGQAIISGEWIFQNNERVIKRAFNLTVPQKEDGYDAMVRTLGEGWQQIAYQIARNIEK